jgi:hypothetical protein
MTILEAVLWGAAGGALPDVLRIIAGRHGEAPPWLRSTYFWVSLALLVVIGGAAAYVATPDKIVTALVMGYSAPSIISKALSNENPPPSLGGGGDDGISSASFIPNPFAELQKWWSR